MAIRFYCPFCDQLLGIAQRKAGAVVECPSCHGKVGVPSEDAPNVELVPPGALGGAAPDSGALVLTHPQVVALLLVLGMLLVLSFAAGLLVGALS
jgi:hypothetical protein